MNRPAARILGLALVVLAATGPSRAWGFLAHRIVAKNAARAAPREMRGFYRPALRRLSDASIQPDAVFRARDGKAEARRHFFELDALARPPFDAIPRNEAMARALFGKRRIERAGLLPWRIAGMYGRLVAAFRENDAEHVVELSGWLSHYVADAYQPLHTTSNHDGRMTGNRGVHKRFESEMIERNARLYARAARLPRSYRPKRIADPLGFIFEQIIANHSLTGRILQADTRAAAVARRGTDAYFNRLEDLAGPLARQQLRKAAAAVADLWYSAWIEAGRPTPAGP